MESRKRSAAGSGQEAQDAGNGAEAPQSAEQASKRPKTGTPTQEQIHQLIARAKEKAAAFGLQARLAVAGTSAITGNPVRPGASTSATLPGLANPVRPGSMFSAAGNAIRPPNSSSVGAMGSTNTQGRVSSLPVSSANPARPSIQLIQQQIAAKQEQLRRALSGNGTASSTALGALSKFQQHVPDKAKGGLNVQYHPALMMDTSKKDSDSTRSKTVLPKPMFTTVKANQHVVEDEPVVRKEYKIDREVSVEFKDPSKNPYFDPGLKASSAIAPKTRPSRGLRFVQHGKYIDIAEKQRALLTLEKLKRDIAEKIKATGIEKEIDLVSDRSLRTEPPPSVEWWDLNLVVDGSYDNFDPSARLVDEDNLINNLVQHPVPIDPPAEPNAPPPRPIMLTIKERKKLRRQRRQEDRKERSEKIRLGLLPPEQPKVRIANMMRVFGEEAISNPSMVEAKVRQQIAARKQKHIDLVASTKLTDVQRKEKLRKQLLEDTSLIVHVAVFRIDDLTHPQHTFKVTQNAQQYNLTGAAIVQPGLNAVIVEGGPKGIKAYKKLMLRRIDWEQKNSNEGDQDDERDGQYDETDSISAPKRCLLVWEGEVTERSFRTFRFKSLPTDSMVREYLKKMHAVQYWDAVCNFTQEGV
ncbi:hypothetical protein BASA61_009408 [Batrachochytrium salamandrivorans]|nr:hypothetical protein BASA60_007874 [Batrachochytrium salamandrivorans]KAH6580798.1 hypothetical protein BASA61_009408 [Batrachochytrium salamandrivorans]KAH9245993.1 hypothetical protein BASA81_016486 [Batrachochytrium salamandrivorans]KAH9274558.1 hypothetical protein BASA83_003194 [Batrachochytrium salamandrivorans]